MKLFQIDINFNLSFDCNDAFEKFEESFPLSTDVRAFEIRAVLSQVPIGKDWTLAFALRTLCSAKTKYSTIETEILAIV